MKLGRTKGSHEPWVGTWKGKPVVVTVDAAVNEFGPPLMKSMIRQSGMSLEDF
jgi:predicted RNA binding protein YcfA (HicA-like mRNA interferase family)